MVLPDPCASAALRPLFYCLRFLQTSTSSPSENKTGLATRYLISAEQFLIFDGVFIFQEGTMFVPSEIKLSAYLLVKALLAIPVVVFAYVTKSWTLLATTSDD